MEDNPIDPDLVIAHPDTRIPPRAELLRVMEQAFAGEEGVEGELLERYAQHAELVLAGNRCMNLLAHVEPLDVAVIYYLDSWRVTRLLPLAGLNVLDLGSGGGFPGYPIALAEPRSRVVLSDSNRNRVEFLQECIDAMGTKNVSCVLDRAEEHLLRNRYDVVILRGIESVGDNIRMLRNVGHSLKQLVMLKPPVWSQEMRAGEGEIERLGFRLEGVSKHQLPRSSMDASMWGKRAVLVFRAPGGMDSAEPAP